METRYSEFKVLRERGERAKGIYPHGADVNAFTYRYSRETSFGEAYAATAQIKVLEDKAVELERKRVEAFQKANNILAMEEVNDKAIADLKAVRAFWNTKNNECLD